MKYISKWTSLRIDHAANYSKLLRSNLEVITPKKHPDSVHVFHLYVIQVNNRYKIQEKLKAHGVSTGIHYPVPLPLMKAYEYLKYLPKDFPNIYSANKNILSLPIFPELKYSDKLKGMNQEIYKKFVQSEQNLLLALLLVDDTDNHIYFAHKYKVSSYLKESLIFFHQCL